MSYSQEELIRDHAFFVKPARQSLQDNGVSLQDRVGELEAEVAKLRQQLGKAKSINDTMWDTMVRKLVSDGKGLPQTSGEAVTDAADGNDNRRKRGRT